MTQQEQCDAYFHASDTAKVTMNYPNKRFYNEETTFDTPAYKGYKVRLWIVNPYQWQEFNVEKLKFIMECATADAHLRTTKQQLDKLLVDVNAFHEDIAAVQVTHIESGWGVMSYTTEYNGDPA